MVALSHSMACSATSTGETSSGRTGAVSRTLGTGHLAGHRLPGKPTLSPSTQKQGHRALEPLAWLAVATQQ